MEEKNMSLIQFHILRNYAPSSLNRDEMGAPKTALFAGVLRGRISSQCLKRAWRSSEAFKELDSFGLRTKYLPELVADRVKELSDTDTYNFALKAKKVIASLGKSKKTKKKDEDKEKADEKWDKTKQLMVFSKEDIDAVAYAVINAKGNIEKLKEEIKQLDPIRPITLDIALFGRMVTDNMFADVEASMQVAHALSVNRVNQESDYFTAVDDLSHVFGEDAGAAHLDENDYNSCCYYQYAVLDVEQLKENLKNSHEAQEKLPQLLNALIDAIIYASPSGKQNSFAAHSLPTVVCLEMKDKKIPISYINAFEEPITHNYSVESSKRLAEEIDKIDKKYQSGLSQRVWFDLNESACPQNALNVNSLEQLKEITADWLK
jgi:CRISPR system Cascade subunit CasC